MTPVVVLTPSLVRRQVKRGQVYQIGRRYVRILGVRTNPPHVIAQRCDRRGKLMTGRHKTGPLAGARVHAFSIFLTWVNERWQLAIPYQLVSRSRRTGALSSRTTPRRAATTRNRGRR